MMVEVLTKEYKYTIFAMKNTNKVLMTYFPVNRNYNNLNSNA